MVEVRGWHDRGLVPVAVLAATQITFTCKHTHTKALYYTQWLHGNGQTKLCSTR